jgi:tRNA pseudouridine38-40 synthase
MEEVFSTILRQDIALTAAGRTDAGVHARKMVAHFDVDKRLDTMDMVARLNSFLPDDIAIHYFHEVPQGAHARFDAVERSYEYWIVQEKNPFFKDTAHYIRQTLDMEAMNKAASILLECNDFECFSKSNTDVKTYLCTIKNAAWIKDDEKLVFTITADRFLRNMVRAIVGTLLDVGQGRMGMRDVKTIIKNKDRSQAGVSVPAKGLYLTEIVYPDNILKFYG